LLLVHVHVVLDSWQDLKESFQGCFLPANEYNTITLNTMMAGHTASQTQQVERQFGWLKSYEQKKITILETMVI